MTVPKGHSAPALLREQVKDALIFYKDAKVKELNNPESQLQAVIDRNRMSITVQQIIEIAQGVCDVGCGENPVPGSLCSLINAA